MKKFFLVLLWPAFTGTLFLMIMVTAYQRYTNPITLFPDRKIATNRTLNASDLIVSQVRGISTDIQTGDARPIIIAEFLKTNDSPLKPYDYWGQYLTNLADTYQLDFRLLPSISMQESNLCKKIPEGSFNCLGLGIHARGTWTFDKFEDNFEAAAKILKKNYIDKGYVTPDEIQDKYTPGSNGSWEFAVNHFMETLEHADF